MQLVVLGLNHKTVSVEVRERFAISVDNINKGLRHLDNYNGISEVVIFIYLQSHRNLCCCR